MELKQIASVLREYEHFCYRIAYFLLEQEEPAVLATKQALLELGRNDRFFTESTEDRWIRAQKVVTRHSLSVSLR